MFVIIQYDKLVEKERKKMYIDPGSGGMLFQILAVMFGVLSGTVLMFSGRIKMFFAKWRRTMRKEDQQDEAPKDDNNSNS